MIVIFIFLEYLLMKNPPPVPEGGGRSLGEEVPTPLTRLLLAMPPLMPGHRIFRLGKQRQTLTLSHLNPPTTVMLRDSFRAIASNPHMSDPEDDAVNDLKRGTKEYNHLQKVSPILELIRNRCKSFYHPRQHISVDERMVATKARLPIKQYMKAKPTKWGLKFFVLADVNGYTVDYRLYTGRNGAATGKGLCFDVVTTLGNKDYLGSGYIVYCDNFYSSPRLFHHLSQQGFGACGTYRQNRVGVPKTQENALKANAARGSIRWIREGELLFVKWMDTREVSILTTVHPVYTGGDCHAVAAECRWGLQSCPCPQTHSYQ
ncbi:hypothetical protein ACEWY4_017153 [Coilia grayii]|uniref:PiggyBac transposable element-derived protein domain-containing protein n=1 Tax=Coilia grayii TaxID=363190 RepID=A0ABD1JH46_9TELE